MDFEWLNIKEVDKHLLLAFQSGNTMFDKFLVDNAMMWQDSGEAVTYIFVDSNELDKSNTNGNQLKFTRIYGYISINATGLLYRNDSENMYLSCVEIRMFAISSVLRKRHDSTITYSDAIFCLALQNLYALSTSTIGFKGIFLNANHDGYDLYKRWGFNELNDFVPPTVESKLNIDGCIPMILPINENMIDNIFLFSS